MAQSNNMLKMGAAAAAVAAGAYFFFGPDGKKHQKKMQGWMVSMKGQVLEKLEDIEDVTEPMYNEVIDTVARGYAVANKIPKEDIMDLAKDLKRHWKTIKKANFMSTSRPASKKSSAKKSSKKASKKSAK